MLKIGMVGEYKVLVDEYNTALNMGSGDLLVFSTPSMIAAMEAASIACVKESLSDDESTVGTKVNIEHVKATPLNMAIKAIATLSEIDERKLVFSVVAEDECGIIGRGIHERFIINKDKFMSKTNAKKGGI